MWLRTVVGRIILLSYYFTKYLPWPFIIDSRRGHIASCRVKEYAKQESSMMQLRLTFSGLRGVLYLKIELFKSVELSQRQ
jgi:hypothetical protein